jgi:hypothetical protein
MKELKELKNNIEWFEKEEDNLLANQKTNLMIELMEINKTLRRHMLTCIAVNKR